MSLKGIVIELNEAEEQGGDPSWRKYNLVYVPEQVREFFPGYKEPFDVETDSGTVKTWMTSSNYFSKGMYQFYDEHPELEPGDKLLIEEKVPEEVYDLEIL